MTTLTNNVIYLPYVKYMLSSLAKSPEVHSHPHLRSVGLYGNVFGSLVSHLWACECGDASLMFQQRAEETTGHRIVELREETCRGHGAV